MLELVEASALYRLQGRVATVVATSLPFRLALRSRSQSVALKAGGIAVNVVIVIYLFRVVHRKGR